MTDTTPEPRRRWVGWAIIAALAAAIVVFIVVGFATAGAAPVPASTSTAATPQVHSSASTSASASSSASPSASPSASKTVSMKPTPQATKSAALDSTATIATSLTASVTKVEAVQGKAIGPGEISGPAVRFTISLTNHTGKAYDLSNAVVNAYYGSADTPANQLERPGGVSFPSSIGVGKTVTGVYVFTIPTAQRSRVQVTVDTSISNPVVAFTGSASK